MLESVETVRAKVLNAKEYSNKWCRLYCSQPAGEGDFAAAGTLLMQDAPQLEGLTVVLEGAWDEHPRFGRSFRFVNIKPEGGDLFFFLARVVKGVGPTLARNMVDHFGEEELLAVLESRHDELLSVKGIGKAKLKSIVTGWEKYRHVKQLSDMLTPYGVTPNAVMRVYTHFEEKAAHIVRTNPYRLTEVSGIGFRKADEIALKIGIEKDSPHRIESCARYVLTEIGEGTGDTVVGKNEMLTKLIEELAIEGGDVELFNKVKETLKKMIEAGSLVEGSWGPSTVSLGRYAQMESDIKKILSKRAAQQPEPLMPPEEVVKYIAKTEAKQGFSFSAEQRQAIEAVAAGHKTLLVTGYAGTGKSTVSRALIGLLLSKYSSESVSCMALSGIAADRIRKLSGFSAATIHSTLRWEGGKFAHNEDSPLDFGVVVVDEASMINSHLFLSVLRAVKEDSVLIVMGDTGQLPPIGAGAPFSDLVDAKACPLVSLTKVYRQPDGNDIAVLANIIREGRVPKGLTDGTETYRGVSFLPFAYPKGYYSMGDGDKAEIRQRNAVEISSKVRTIVADWLQDPPEQTNQILTPMRKGELGTEGLNSLYQEVMNPLEMDNQVMPISGGAKLKPGDKVVHVKNKNMKVEIGGSEEVRRVFNGTVGQVRTVDAENKEVVVDYFNDGFIAVYDSLLLSAGVLEHAGALTVHKAQGSEYDTVVIPITSSHTIMLNSRWLYTAVTRAKNKVVLVGQPQAFVRGCKKAEESKRKTYLAGLLVDKQGRQRLERRLYGQDTESI